MWQEGYYRGYFLLNVSPKKVTAQFYGEYSSETLARLLTDLGSPSVATRNPWDIPLANFTVLSGENHLHRPVADGKVESGSLRYGEVKHTNLSLNTETGKWKHIEFETMYVNSSEVPK